MLRSISNWQRKRREIALIKENFDEAFYLAQHPELASASTSAFEHFMSLGWRIGYDPAPWFSLEDYFEANPDIKADGLNPFRHFLIWGESENRQLSKRAFGKKNNEDLASAEYESESEKSKLPPKLRAEVIRVEQSGYFDRRYYLSEYRDLEHSELDPAVHFCMYGWREGRNPSEIFKTSFFEENFPRGRSTTINPIIDFLDSGLEENFIPNPLGLLKTPDITAPTDTDWTRVGPLVSGALNSVDIIIPVYKGFDETLRCLHTVLTAENTAGANLIVIDDASPDPDLSAKLSELAEAGLFTLLVNETNLGFVKTANRGMRLNTARDIVLLNSDTEVYDFWLDQILAHAASDTTIASITPLSNNATICSYPVTLENNNYHIEIGGPAINQIAFEVNKGQAVDVPTGVGFCMYIRREALSQTGYFDEFNFAKGYGEENDFCMRTAQGGWRNVLALDTYVRHHGEVSFGKSASAAQAKGLLALTKKHPVYPGVVENYIKRDPARSGRARIDAARLKYSLGDIALFVSHDWGGGIERSIKDLSAELDEEGLSVVVLRSLGAKTELVRVDVGDGFLTPSLERIHINADAELLAEIIAILAPKLIHVHSLSALISTGRASAMRLIRESGVPYYFTCHDYALICPHTQFVTPAGSYCGEPGPAGCVSCIKRHPPQNGWVTIDSYQSSYRDFIRGAHRVFAPSQDAAIRVNTFLGEDICIVSVHPELHTMQRDVRQVGKIRGKAFRKMSTRIALAGAIGPHKGRDIMESCARDSDARGLDIYFRLIGYSDTGSIDIPNLTVTGKYRDDAECMALLKQYQPHFVAFLSIWPETYSYALSLAFRANIPPVVFDIGAMAERVRLAGFGHCVPHAWRNSPAEINDFLLANPLSPLSRLAHRRLLKSMDEQAPRALISSEFYSATR